MGERSVRFGDLLALFHTGSPAHRARSPGGGWVVRDDPAALRRRIDALERRISELSRATVRISASLDPGAVVQEVVDSARSLTGARYGLITTVDETGRPLRFVTSGMTATEQRHLEEWVDGPRLFEHLVGLPEAAGFDDIPAYLLRQGFGEGVMPLTVSTGWGTGIDCHGGRVGYLFVADKEGGGAFTAGDEEVLPLLAAHAGPAIANARAYRDERRARARLGALIDTSPVGVVVLDAATGDLVSLNREAKRIVESLRMPDRSMDALIELVTCRRADGSEVALTDLPLERELRRGETVRAEEIELSVPDGRSVRTLINSTPILSPEGEVESVVVTMQDLAPFEELERMRTEFLAIVSHELRTPLTSIQGSTGAVLSSEPGFARAEMMQFFRIIDEQAARMSGLIRDLLDAGRIATGTLSVSPEASDVAVLGGLGEEEFPGRRRPAHGHRGHSHRAAPRDGRPGAHRPGADQPLLERGPALRRVVAHPGRRPARWRCRGDFGIRPGPGHSAGAAPAPLQETRGRRGRGPRSRERPRPGHLQGAGRGPRRAHPGRERGRGAGRPFHLHGPGGRRRRGVPRGGGSGPWEGGAAPRGAGTADDPRGGRRARGAALRP